LRSDRLETFFAVSVPVEFLQVVDHPGPIVDLVFVLKVEKHSLAPPADGIGASPNIESLVVADDGGSQDALPHAVASRQNAFRSSKVKDGGTSGSRAT